MKRLGANELREMYLQYFEEKGHHRLPGASLVPSGDPTLLFTGAGMVPFKPYFLGLETPKHRRVTTCQRCLRTGDIHNVGMTSRHHTFFEMLGNFSFGDYFKEEAIAFAWEFVTERLEIDPDRLWASIYLDDDEAHALWHEKIGLPTERIVRLGKEDNFWEIGVGPCGPCSEIYYDRGAEYGCDDADCVPGCEQCERYLEIWNLVFIQFHQDEEGNLTPLKSKGVDTGMGLERTVSLLQGVESNFDIDTIRPIVDYVAETAGVTYGKDSEHDVSLRVITDHMRGVAFMIHDGILPGNEGRGYVLRRLLRRSVRHARLLGIEKMFLPDVTDRVIDLMVPGYPEIAESREYIRNVVATEERRFNETLDQGMEILDRLTAQLKPGEKTLSGEDAFRLYDTYGFPIELTEEILDSRGLQVDRDGFEEAMEAQRQRARAARAQTGYLGDAKAAYTDLDLPVSETSFVGYDVLESQAEVIALIAHGEPVGRVEEGDEVEVFLDVTPFYPQGGGQVADRGVLASEQGDVHVEDVERVAGDLIVHRGKVTSGSLRVGDQVRASVNQTDRWKTARHHTATHLLHKALHEVLGEHANQAGSLVAPDRLRFDFTHFKPVTPEELVEIERRVNEKILENLPVETKLTSFDQARREGALALFGEKYGDQVRVVQIGEYSKELCGGTHVTSSADLGLFKVTSEGGVAAGVRRIEAVSGSEALDYVWEEEAALTQMAERLQVAPKEAPRQLERVLENMRELERELSRLKGRLAQTQADKLLNSAEEVGGVKVVVGAVDGIDMDGLRALGDRLKEQLGVAALVLGSTNGSRVSLVAMATDDAAELGVHVGEALKKAAPIVSGGGGGHARMAQAGGKDPSRLEEALQEARERIVERLHERQARQA